MARLWSPQRKFSTWRRLWVALAEAEHSLGLPITEEQIAALRSQVDTIDFDRANAYEKRFRHDVMAHVHAFGDAAPAARAIIHLGATSCYVTDNADLILIRQALELIRDKTVAAIDALATFADDWKELPCLGYTHFQPAQLVTVGKRATLWCHELVLDLEEIERRLAGLKFLGAKGTTGTQASFLELFGGDDAKVVELDRQGCRRVRLLRRSIRSLGRPIRERSTPRWLAALAGSGRERHTDSAPTCACWRTSKRSKSRSRPSRSAPRRWLTSATRCGRSECARSPGSLWRWPRLQARRRQPSGSSARSTIARSAAS